MKVLLDECLPSQLKSEFPDYSVSTVQEMGWAGKRNGTLLRLAEGEFDVFLTVDRGLAYQQNLKSFKVGIISIASKSNRFPALRPFVPEIKHALQKVHPHQIICVGDW